MRNFGKKFLAISLSLSVLFLVACKGSETPEKAPEQPVEVEKSDEKEDEETKNSTRGEQKLVNKEALAEQEELAKYSFTINDVVITPGEAAENIIADLGDPLSTYEAPSCVFEGNDKVYVYDGFEVNTAPFQGQEVIVGVFFTPDSTQKTATGIGIGSSLEEVESAYGKPNKENQGQLFWENDQVEFSLVLINDKVTAVSYLGIFEGY